MTTAVVLLNEPPRIENEALPCPFCGSPAASEYWHGGAPTKLLIGCSGLECEVRPSVTGETRDEAIAHWNRRALVVTP